MLAFRHIESGRGLPGGGKIPSVHIVAHLFGAMIVKFTETLVLDKQHMKLTAEQILRN